MTVALLAALVPALQEATLLREAYREAARYRTERRIEIERRGEERQGGRVLRRDHTRIVSTTRYVDTVRSVVRGEITEAERAYEAYEEVIEDLLNGQRQVQPSSLPGRTIRLLRRGGTTVVDHPLEVRASDTEGARLPSLALARCYPERPVQPGDQWPVAQGALLELLEIDPRTHAVSQLEGTARLERIEELEAVGRCAVVRTSGTLECSSRNGVQIDAEFEMTSWLSLAEGYPARIRASATLYVRHPGGENAPTQEGTVRMSTDMSVRLLP